MLFSGTSVRLSDDAQSAASPHAPKKGCAEREVRAANLQCRGRLSLLTFFDEAKKVSRPRRDKAQR
ncbi:hypothetical protein GCWU000324_02823 [Kingella oralis ATCC 51147]|uniref:Uncharacterized protein n=1 Tax=Kingella oralis ATCC 51147 TaxID=629741 RepID=C4GM90_9NEIS|nr:hypothetical protein GCWU000324_02823 [Kingella oralis ATCC 51147]